MNFAAKIFLASVSACVLFCHLSISESSDSSDSWDSSDSSDSSDSESSDYSYDTDTVNKPGNCPYFNPMLRCAVHPPNCTCDADCPNDDKCCDINCLGRKCTDPVKPGACPVLLSRLMCIKPPNSDKPINECENDADCDYDDKCCWGCPGQKCKPPKCPSTYQVQPCDRACKSDDECKGRGYVLCCQSSNTTKGCNGGSYCI